MPKNPHIPRRIRLSPEETKELEDMEADVEEAEFAMREMEESGVDFGNVKAQLLAAKKTRLRLLRAFTTSNKVKR